MYAQHGRSKCEVGVFERSNRVFFFSTPDWSKNVIDCYEFYTLGFPKFFNFLEHMRGRFLGLQLRQNWTGSFFVFFFWGGGNLSLTRKVHHFLQSLFFSPLRAFHTSVNRWFFTGARVITSLLTSPGLFSVFLPITVVWMVSTRPLISNSSSPCTKHLVIVPSAPTTFGIIVTFIFHSFFNSLF